MKLRNGQVLEESWGGVTLYCNIALQFWWFTGVYWGGWWEPLAAKH